MITRQSIPKAARRAIRAFTLIEVMIAVGIFFMALISILGNMTQCLRAARGLQRGGPDVGLLAAEFSSRTNQLHDGKSERGDFGKRYPGFTWERETFAIASNGLFEVNFYIFKGSFRGPELFDALSIWLYRPESPRGDISRPAFGGGRGR